MLCFVFENTVYSCTAAGTFYGTVIGPYIGMAVGALLGPAVGISIGIATGRPCEITGGVPSIAILVVYTFKVNLLVLQLADE